MKYKLVYTNSYQSTIGRHTKKTWKFWKKGFPLEPRYARMCTFSTKKLRHWHMRFETLACTILFLYQDTIQDSRLIRIHFHATSLYWGVFNILKITTTTHNDIVCVSFNSKSAHSILPIFIYKQKEDSLSFPTVSGSGGCGLSLLNKICIGAKCRDRDFYGVLIWF